MSRDHLVALGLGVLAALFYLSISLRSPGAVMLANLAQLPIFVAGLGWGPMAALIAAGVASAVVVAVVPTYFVALFVLSVVAPVVILTWLALQSRESADGVVEWYPPGYLLAWLGGCALVFLVGATLYFAGDEGGIEGAAYRYVKVMLTAMVSDGDEARLEALAVTVSRILPATALTSWQFVFIVNGYLAQGLLARFNHNIRPGAPFAELELPRWLMVLLIVCLAAALMGGQIGFVGRNGAVVVSVPFFFVGLSVIHALTRRWPGRAFALLVVYLLILFQGWPVILVAGLGFVEQWLHLRRRRAGPGKSRENE